MRRLRWFFFFLNVITLPVYAKSYYLQTPPYDKEKRALKVLKQVRSYTRNTTCVLKVDFLVQKQMYILISGFPSHTDALQMQRRLKKENIRTLVHAFDTTTEAQGLYGWTKHPLLSSFQVENAQRRLGGAIAQPERLLDDWIGMPIAADSALEDVYDLSLRDAILLSLRYNPDIQNAELDRIIQRYNLRQTQNELELQYALSGSAGFERDTINGQSSKSKTYIVTPELKKKSTFGTQYQLRLNNNYNDTATYNPELSLNVSQPLLRGFGPTANTTGVKNALDGEKQNKLALKQTLMNQVTNVIRNYRDIINTANNLRSQKNQLKDAQQTYTENQLKIRSGQLEASSNIQQSFQIKSLRLSVLSSENSLKNQKQAFLTLLGLDPDMRIRLPDDVDLGDIRIPKEKEAIALAFVNNTEYLRLLIGVKQDERDYALALNEQLWQLDLEGAISSGSGASNRLSSVFKRDNVTKSLNLRFSIPLNDVNRRSRLINAKLRLEKDRIQLVAGKRKLISEVKRSVRNLHALVEAYKLSKEQIGFARQAYTNEKLKQKAGIASSLNVSNTQNQLLDAQKNLISAKTTYLNELASLQALLGTTLQEWNLQFRYLDIALP